MSSGDAPDDRSGRAGRWLAGLVVGATGALLLVLAGSLGVVAWTLLAVWLIARPVRLPALAGLPVGFGAVMLGLLLRAEAACQPAECVSPDLSGWVALATGCLVGGALATVGLIARTRAH